MRLFIVIGLTIFLFPARYFSQVGEEELDSVAVTGYRIPQPGITTLPKSRIDNRLANDVGQLMTLFPGMQLKSYGGLGGLKTVSFRSLGAGHTSVVIDKFALSQTQSGQTDLGQIPVDFIRKIEVVNQAVTSISYPVHSKIAGQIIALETRHLPLYADTFQLSAGVQLGSFNQQDLHSFAGKEWSKIKIGLSGKARRFTGDYPFSYRNANTDVSTVRKNGDLQDLFGTASISWLPTDKSTFHLNLSGAYFDKGLPGAVVFYNETAGQRLYGGNRIATLRHEYRSTRFEIASGISVQQNSLDYIDSSYLNSQGYLHSHFESLQLEGQSQAKYVLNEKNEVLLGAEVRKETLESASLSIIPDRQTIDGIAGYKLHSSKNTLSLQLALTDVTDIRPVSRSHSSFLLPLIDLSRRLSAATSVSAGYRMTVRQPTFNELYYNQAGNDDLRAEKAHLGWIRATHGKSIRNWRYQVGIQPFYVYAKNKILAIPTKNLFIWSIQNIGLSQAIGSEATVSLSLKTGESTFGMNLNYTFQYTQDLSNSAASSFGDQLSYSPLHSGTTELNFTRKKTGASVLISYQGERYTLNQNIEANLMEDFLLVDFSCYYKIFLGKRKSQLTARLALNNLTNNYYSYIRYFVMPGLNWALRLNYEF